MKIHEIKTYSYNELPENIKEKVMEKYYNINTDHDWWDFLEYELKEMGIELISFDIFRGSKCELKFINGGHEIADYIINNHGEKCDTYKNASLYLKNRDEIVDNSIDDYEMDIALDELRDEFKKELEEDYLVMLRNNYEYLTSDESIKETFIANEYDFTIDGNIF